MTYDTFPIRSVRSLCWVVCAFLGLSVGSRIEAQTVCYQYKSNLTESWSNTPTQACAPVFAQWDANTQYSFNSRQVSETSSNNWACVAQQYTKSPPFGSVVFQGQVSSALTTRENPDGCPPPDQCSGLKSEGVGDQFTSLHYPGADGYCNPVSNCKMSVDSSVEADGTTIYKVLHTDLSCAHGAVPPPVGDQAVDGETCGGANPEFCLAKAGENCGYLNDSFVCLPKVGETECAVFGDGGRVCGNRAPTPPVPDNGTPGTAATPAAAVTSTVNNVSTTFNYFNATQVAGSSRDPGASGDDPYDEEGGDNGDCDPATEECGEGSVSGGEFCSAEPVCTGDAIQCAIVEQQWRNRCVAPVTDEERTAMFAGLANDDIDGDGASEGIAEGMPWSSDDPIDILSDFDSDGWLGGRTCPATYSVDLSSAFGGAINISLSEACFFFQIIGSIVLVMAWFEAAKIVVTGFF